MSGEFDGYGGRHVPEPLEEPLAQLADAYDDLKDDPDFRAELDSLLRDFAGRPTPLYHAERLSEAYGAEIYLKREDLLHGGAHKVNRLGVKWFERAKLSRHHETASPSRTTPRLPVSTTRFADTR